MILYIFSINFYAKGSKTMDISFFSKFMSIIYSIKFNYNNILIIMDEDFSLV